MERGSYGEGEVIERKIDGEGEWLERGRSWRGRGGEEGKWWRGKGVDGIQFDLLPYSCSRDGQYIISGSEDKYIYIWRTHNDVIKLPSTRRDRSELYESFSCKL